MAYLKAVCCFYPHLPCESVALAGLVPKVADFAVLDVHPGLSHIVLGQAEASLVVVGDDFRDGADVRPAVGLIFVGGVRGGVPRKHLIGCTR